MAIQLDPNEWSISAPPPGTKGGKTCLISNQNKPIEINMGLGSPLGCPWGASSFDDGSIQVRINLDMTLNEENADLFRQIDEWLIAYAIKNKETLFNKTKTDLQISESSWRLARVKQGYQPMLRTKINLEKVRCWDENHTPTKVPDRKIKHADVWPKMIIRTLWFIGSGPWGLTLEVTDLKFRELLTACPF